MLGLFDTVALHPGVPILFIAFLVLEGRTTLGYCCAPSYWLRSRHQEDSFETTGSAVSCASSPAEGIGSRVKQLFSFDIGFQPYSHPLDQSQEERREIDRFIFDDFISFRLITKYD